MICVLYLWLVGRRENNTRNDRNYFLLNFVGRLIVLMMKVGAARGSGLIDGFLLSAMEGRVGAGQGWWCNHGVPNGRGCTHTW